MTRRPRFPQMPIAGRVMVLLFGVLVVAQTTTLVLTLAFPPQPPPQHSLEDIARAMRGQAIQAEGARPLVREIVDQAPRPEGPGWLSASGPRDRLAAMLNADPSDVVLMFYVPLPAGAQPMTRPATRSQGEPERPTPPMAEPQSETPLTPDRAPTFVAAAFIPTGAANPLLIRARYSAAGGPAPFAGRATRGFASGGFSPNGVNPALRNGAWPRQTSRINGARSMGASRRPQALTSPNHDPARTLGRSVGPNFSPPVTGDAATARPFGGGAWPRPAGSAGDGAALQPGGAGLGRAMAAALVERRRAAASLHQGGGIGTSVSTSVRFASPAPDAKPSTVIETPPVSADARTAPAAAPVAPVQMAAVATVAPILAEPPQTQAVPTRAADRSEAALEPDDVILAPVVAAPVRRGLFAPTPAGYIEGDFIAAQRVGDRWIVVEPRPEGFPTAWQSRVMLWFLLSFALVAPFGWLFARRITAPLRSFADAAERLGRDPSAPATVQGGSAEIGRAAAAFNLMQERLKRYVDDRTAMIGAISHDLRTPLTRMRFRLEAAPDKLKPGFETDIDQMEAMISSVLTFMRDQAEGGVRQRLDLRALLGEAVDNAVAGGADVALEPGEAVEVEADAVALNRVFSNLLDNAVKYGGRAVVRLNRDGGDAVAAVRDFGPGLPDSELERVFKPFYRAPHAVASDAPGLGLGLANSRSVILAHGGAIRLTSQDGLTAEVRLPAAA